MNTPQLKQMKNHYHLEHGAFESAEETKFRSPGSTSFRRDKMIPLSIIADPHHYHGTKTTIDTEYMHRAVLDDGHWLETEQRIAHAQETLHHESVAIDEEETKRAIETASEEPLAGVLLLEMHEVLVDIMETLDGYSCCYGGYDCHENTAALGEDLVGLAFVPEGE